MKTVQEVLLELNTNDLVYLYLKRQPISIVTLEKANDISAGDLLHRVKTRIENFINYMRTVPIIYNDDKKCILFVYESVDDIILKESYAMVYLDEILKDRENASTYAYEFSPRGEIAGYYVADTERTQDDIYGLMTDVLFEASFFGFDEEAVTEEREKLDQSIKEIEEGKTKFYTHEEVFGKFGIKEEIRTKEELQKRDEFTKALLEYNRFLYKKALDEVLKTLK